MLGFHQIRLDKVVKNVLLLVLNIARRELVFLVNDRLLQFEEVVVTGLYGIDRRVTQPHPRGHTVLLAFVIFLCGSSAQQDSASLRRLLIS